MAIVVAPLVGFNSLLSVAAADAYWSGLPGTEGTAWAAATVPQKEGALRRATQYILGLRIRLNVIEPVVYQAVKDATAEAASRALANTLYTDVDPRAVTEETVGPLTVKYAGRTNRGQLRFPIIDDLLRGLTVTAPFDLSFERA